MDHELLPGSSVIPATLTLWSMQTLQGWKTLKSGMVLRCDPMMASPVAEPGLMESWGVAYDWIAECLHRRDPKPSAAIRWPMWAWWTFENDSGPRRPDLRKARPIQPGVLLELRTDARRVLLTDFDGWHAVLNNFYAGPNYQLWWQRWEDSQPGSAERAYLEHIRRKSWRRCLSINPTSSTQAVLWEIRPEDVTRHWVYQGWR